MKDVIAFILKWSLLIAGPFVAAASFWALWSFPLLWLPAAFGLFCVTLLFYGFIMLAEYVNEKVAPLPKELYVFAQCALFIGYLLDWALNAIVFSVLMLWPPLELTVSERLSKYGKSSGWWGKVARYFGKVWINPLDLIRKEHIPVS